MARAAGLNKEDGLAVIKVLERLAGRYGDAFVIRPRGLDSRWSGDR
jgi:hypothetical protein